MWQCALKFQCYVACVYSLQIMLVLSVERPTGDLSIQTAAV